LLLVGLVPALLAIGFLTGKSIERDLESVEMVRLVLTLAVCSLTFSGGRTNVIQATVHVVLFLACFVLIFNP